MARFHDDDGVSINRPTGAAGDPAGGPAVPSGQPDDQRGRHAGSRPVRTGTRPPGAERTRISGIWGAVTIAMVILVFLLIFILQNLRSVTVHYLGTASSVPLGVALLLSAVGGGLLVALIGAARIIQLRRTARRRAEPSSI